MRWRRIFEGIFVFVYMTFVIVAISNFIVILYLLYYNYVSNSITTKKLQHLNNPFYYTHEANFILIYTPISGTYICCSVTIRQDG